MAPLVPLLLFGCGDDEIFDHVPAAAFSQSGFARARAKALKMRGREIKVWGFVDGSNVFPERGEDNHHGHWHFHLKSKAKDQAGESFAIHIPVDEEHDNLVNLFEANDLASKPTRVFMTGNIFTFDTRVNFSLSTSFFMKANPSRDILLKTPAEK